MHTLITGGFWLSLAILVLSVVGWAALKFIERSDGKKPEDVL